MVCPPYQRMVASIQAAACSGDSLRLPLTRGRPRPDCGGGASCRAGRIGKEAVISGDMPTPEQRQHADHACDRLPSAIEPRTGRQLAENGECRRAEEPTETQENERDNR